MSGNPSAKLFCTLHRDFHDSLINLPVLLAIQVVTGASADWFNHPERFHPLRAYRAFDPDWFEEGFDLSIARCLSIGILKPR